MGTSMQTMNVKEFDVILKGPERPNYQIIDVREKSELQTASIANQGIINLPLSEKSRWSKEILSGNLLDSTKPTLCICHHGGRSAQMVSFLSSEAKFSTVHNVVGGIHEYAKQVDSSIPVY